MRDRVDVAPGLLSVQSVTTDVAIVGEASACPYVGDETMQRRYLVPTEPVDRAALDQRLEVGQRRNGFVFYGQACTQCMRCQSLRVRCGDFQRSHAQERVFRRGQRDVQVQIGVPSIDARRLELYRAHELGQNLGVGETMDLERYREAFLRSAVETVEFAYFIDEVLVAIALADVGATSLSLVYTYWDPAYARYSLGTYSILVQIEVARRLFGPDGWVYLGLIVPEAQHLAYKAKFLPHQRLTVAGWQWFA